MRILLVTGSLFPMKCGVGDYTLSLANALSALGLEIGVLTSREASAETDSKGGIKVFPVMDGWHLNEMGRARDVIRTWRPDIVHVQYPARGYRSYILPSLLPLIAFIMGSRAIRTWHEMPALRHFPSFLLQAMPWGRFITVRPGFLAQMPRLLKLFLIKRLGKFIPGASAIPRRPLLPRERARFRARYLNERKRLIVFFGFLYEFKGADLLFKIADPEKDQLVFAGEPGEDSDYCDGLRRAAGEPDWHGHATITGFLPSEEIARLLAAADAVVLPFRKGGGIWNSSIHAAVLNATPVITTSEDETGLDPRRLVYFAEPGDIGDMKRALNRLAGQRRPFNEEIDRDEWERVAREHLLIYRAESVSAES